MPGTARRTNLVVLLLDSVVFGKIDPLERTRQDAAGIRGQALDDVALIENDVLDIQLASRLSSQRLFVADVPSAVTIIVGLAVQLLRHNLPAEIDSRSAIPKTRSAGSACAQAAEGRASCRKLSLASEAPIAARRLLSALWSGDRK